MRKNKLFFAVIALILVAVVLIGMLSNADTKFPWESGAESIESNAPGESGSGEPENETAGQTYPLGTPTVTLSGETLRITSGSGGATGYEIYVNGDYLCVTGKSTVDLSVALLDYAAGDYVVTVRAYDARENRSDFSNSVTYTHGLTEATGLTAPTVSLDGSSIVVVSGAGTATHYEILKSISGEGYASEAFIMAFYGTQKIDITAMLTGGDNYFMVRAINTATGESALCMTVLHYNNATGITTLSTPSLSASSTSSYVWNISEVENATGYEVWIDGVYEYNTTAKTVSFADMFFESGSYAVKVRAYYITSSGTVYSEFSNVVYYVVPSSLARPIVHLSDSEHYFTITTVPYATGYEIYVDGDRVLRTLIPEFTLMEFEYPEGDYTLTVRAYYERPGDGAMIYSDFSTPVTYTVQYALATPTISLSGSVLTIASASSDATGFEIYANGDYLCATANLTVNLSDALSEYEAGDYSITVRACDDSEHHSGFSNAVTYSVA